MGSDEKKTTIKHIHESIIIRILCFLPADSVIRCRSVCKNWATLIFSQCFAEFYSLSATRPLQFLLPGTVGHVTNNHKNLFLADLDRASINAHNVRVLPVTTKSVLPGSKYSPPMVKLCSTCNFTGFIVVYKYLRNINEIGHSYHVFNPITGQHIVVQQNSSNAPWKNCALLLAHKTNQLKLLKVFYKLGSMPRVEIQTIGTYSWRILRNSTLLFDVNENFGFPCFLNGLYHWPCWIRGIMVCFDPDEEVIHCIPTPHCIEDYYSACLGILDDCLCICVKTLDVNGDLEFWVMKQYGAPESWIKKLVIPNEGIICSISDPVRFLKHGENVVVCDDYNVMCYNLSTRNRKCITYYVKSDTIFWYVPIPYVPNLRRFVIG